MFRDDVGRDPTNVELFDIAQVRMLQKGHAQLHSDVRFGLHSILDVAPPSPRLCCMFYYCACCLWLPTALIRSC